MPTETEPVKRKGPMNRLLGFRLLVEPVPQDAIKNSWLWIPESQREQVIQAKVIQVGKYRKTKSRKGKGFTAEEREGRGEIEVKAGDQVLISTEKGHYPLPVEENGRKFRIVSARDCIAIVTEPETSQNPSAR